MIKKLMKVKCIWVVLMLKIGKRTKLLEIVNQVP
ncbi:hypothetical protein GALL_526260 [mine drainage metagenome]|uniref:Uncharacterized protein n=1 Tax=mine drainage metagenome TaxID=410659 RepID=A0A1J5PQF6_9ZZZZ